MGMDRRAFLRRTGLLGTAAVLGDTLLGACAPPVDFEGIGREYHPSFVPEGSILDLPASESPIDTVVILMMENRSFDHYLGWLGRDGDYLERGVRNYGPTFRIDARSHQTYLTPDGEEVDSFHLPSDRMPNPWRGCGYEDPGHGWGAGRAQRDRGFLGRGSDNDRFALGYYEADDLPTVEDMGAGNTNWSFFNHPSIDAGFAASGGVLSSNPIGASGMIRCAEAAIQVMGKGGDHQVPDVRKAFGHAYGGGSQYFSMWLLGADKP